MNKLYILVGFTLNFSLLFSQMNPNNNIYTEDEAMKLSNYGKALEKSILEKNPADSAKIAKLTGDYSQDLCGYSDSSVIKISEYLRELEKLDSVKPIVEEVVEPVIEPVIVPVVVVETPKAPKETIILFASNSSVIKNANIDALVSELRTNRNLTVAIDAYTDETASDEYNLVLSKRRAKSVKDLLVSKGVEAKRISTLGHGEKDPIASNSTEEGKAQNRRAIITVK